MSETSALPEDLLRDAEEMLRLIDALLAEFRASEREDRAAEEARVSAMLRERTARPEAIQAVSLAVLRVYTEMKGALGALREARGTLEAAASGHARALHGPQRPGPDAAEPAGDDMLDTLSRSLEIIDRLDALHAATGSAGSEAPRGLHDALRDQLFHLIGCLQFQYVPWQRVHDAAHALLEVEQRLETVTDLLEAPVADPDPGESARR